MNLFHGCEISLNIKVDQSWSRICPFFHGSGSTTLIYHTDALCSWFWCDLFVFARPNNDQLDVIIRGMKNLSNVDFTHIGPDWNTSSDDDDDGAGGSGAASNGHSQPPTNDNNHQDQELARLV